MDTGRILGGLPMPRWEQTGGVGRLPERPAFNPSDRSALSLLSQYLALSTAHEDRVQQLHWQVLHREYSVRPWELSHSIVDFYVAVNPGGDQVSNRRGTEGQIRI